MSFGIPVRNGLGLGLLASTSLATGNVGFTLPAPTLNLNFTTMTALPSTITFSRPSNATYYDSTGKLTYAPNNLMTYSQDFTNAAWTKQTIGTVTADVAVAPDGTTTADKLFETAATSVFGVYRSAAVGYGRIFSMYVKAAERNYVQFYDPSAGSLGQFVVDLTTGLVTQNTGSLVYAATAAANGFYRISVVLPSGTVFVGAAVSATSTASSSFGTSYAGTAGYGIYIWGGQLEAVTYQTTPGTYNATTSAVYYGARLDYNPATLAARGLLIEEARTNSQTNSSRLSGWSMFAGTITLDSLTSPDGTVNAASILETTANSLHQFYSGNTFTSVIGTTYTFSIFAKANGRTRCQINPQTTMLSTIPEAFYDLSTGTVDNVGAGATASIQSVGNGWYRLIYTFTADTATSGGNFYINLVSTGTTKSYPGNASLGMYFYGGQFETGSFPTSYIPTAASSVARSADTASMTGTDFSSWYNATAGAFLVQFDTPASGTRIISAADDNTANNNIQMLTSGTDPTFLVTTSGTVQASIDAGTVAANTVYKFAGTYSANDFAACISGGTVGTDTSGTIPTVDRLRIGAGQAGNTLCGHVASLVYYPQRLPNATLQSLTS